MLTEWANEETLEQVNDMLREPAAPIDRSGGWSDAEVWAEWQTAMRDG